MKRILALVLAMMLLLPLLAAAEEEEALSPAQEAMLAWYRKATEGKLKVKSGTPVYAGKTAFGILDDYGEIEVSAGPEAEFYGILDGN